MDRHRYRKRIELLNFAATKIAKATQRSTTYYGLLRVRADKDGRLVPLWYTVGDADRWLEATVVNFEHTIAFCTLSAHSMEEARENLKKELRGFELLLKGVEPEPWFAEGAEGAEGDREVP